MFEHRQKAPKWRKKEVEYKIKIIKCDCLIDFGSKEIIIINDCYTCSSIVAFGDKIIVKVCNNNNNTETKDSWKKKTEWEIIRKPPIFFMCHNDIV